MQIDLNVDVAEGFNIESDVLPFVSSCNIACGSHAGDPEEMKRVVQLAKKYKVRIGAHPGFPDRENFGRLEMDISCEDLLLSIKSQVNLLNSICKENHAVLNYIKPHGALYHLVCFDANYAEVFAEFVKNEFSDLAIMGLPNSVLEKACLDNDLKFIREGFADRVYEKDGSLRKRSLEGSVLQDVEEVVNQVVHMVTKHEVVSFSGEIVDMNIDSICLHGDHDGAAERIKDLVDHLKSRNILVR